MTDISYLQIAYHKREKNTEKEKQYQIFISDINKPLFILFVIQVDNNTNVNVTGLKLTHRLSSSREHRMNNPDVTIDS